MPKVTALYRRFADEHAGRLELKAKRARSKPSSKRWKPSPKASFALGENRLRGDIEMDAAEATDLLFVVIEAEFT